MNKELKIIHIKTLEKLRSKTVIEPFVSYGSSIILLLLVRGSFKKLLRSRISTQSAPASTLEMQEKPQHSGPILFYVATEDSGA